MAALSGEREPCHASVKPCESVRVQKMLTQLACVVWDLLMVGSCRPAEGSGVGGPGGWEGAGGLAV